MAFVAQGILFLRDKDASFNLSISQMLFALFYSQGATYVLLGNYLDYSSDFANSTRYSILFSLCTTLLWFFNPLYRKGRVSYTHLQPVSGRLLATHAISRPISIWRFRRMI